MFSPFLFIFISSIFVVLLRYRSVLDEAGWRNVICLVGDVDGKEVEYFRLNQSLAPELIDTGSSIFKENTVYFKNESLVIRETRQMFTIDSILEAAGLEDEPFQIIKLDIQGSELNAIRGASRLLRRSPKSIIIVETSIVPYNAGGPSALEIQVEMENLGYVLADVVSVSRAKSKIYDFNIPIQADYFYINRDVFQWDGAGWGEVPAMCSKSSSMSVESLPSSST